MVSENYREFEATDPFGAKWRVAFVWLQNAISIRHADAVDVKFNTHDGVSAGEKVIALPHPVLRALASRHSRALNDAWCMKLAAIHLRGMIESAEDLDKTLVSMTEADIEAANNKLEAERSKAA